MGGFRKGYNTEDMEMALRLQREGYGIESAMEARVYAEDPEAGFLPQTGRVLVYREPGGPGVRVDSYGYAGYRTNPNFDSLLAKVIVHGDDRASAVAKRSAAIIQWFKHCIIVNFIK